MTKRLKNLLIGIPLASVTGYLLVNSIYNQTYPLKVGECVRELGDHTVETVTEVTSTRIETTYRVGSSNVLRVYDTFFFDKTYIKVECK